MWRQVRQRFERLVRRRAAIGRISERRAGAVGWDRRWEREVVPEKPRSAREVMSAVSEVMGWGWSYSVHSDLDLVEGPRVRDWP